jgi:transcriptional regulator with XRE-family HTH domain
MTQEELASRAGVHRTAIGLLEQGHRMARADTLVQLAGALSIPPGNFFDGVSWSPAPDPVTPDPGRFRIEAPRDDDAGGPADD